MRRNMDVASTDRQGLAMFAPLILGVIAIYMIFGWIVILALDRRIGRRRGGGALWVAVLFWPVTVIVDLISRSGPNRP
jgi:hypothetical protein